MPDREHPPSALVGCHLRRAIALIVVAAGAACATSESTSVLRELPPAPLVVLVESAAAAPNAGDSLHFVANATEMRSMLAEELRALDAGSRVVTRPDLGSDVPDVTVTFDPHGPITFSHVGAASYLGAGGLWLVTWIGGLLMPDSTYRVSMDATCRFARTEDHYFERAIKGGEVDLSFFERNSLLSWPGLQSLVLPPFWTSDQSDKTSDTLTRSAMRLAARQVATELKNEFESAAEAEFKCSVRVQTPRNGQAVTGATMPIELVAVSQGREPVSRVTVSVNGREPTELQIGASVGAGWEVRGQLTGLNPNAENFVRIQVTVDDLYSRTIRLAPQQ